MSLRIIFAGTPHFATRSLENLLDAGFDVCAAYTQPDRPAGRGRTLMASPVKQCAINHNVPVQQPETLRNDDVQSVLRAYGADVMVVVAYGLLLPKAVLDIPRLGCINVHASLLPRWRGAAPIQHAILSGDCVTGVTIMQMDEGLDTGAVLAKQECTISPQHTAGTLTEELSHIGAELLVDTLRALFEGSITPTAQDDAQATYAPKIKKPDAQINWKQTAEEIDRHVRAYNPWPGAFTSVSGTQIKIWSTCCHEDSGAPGEIIATHKNAFDVATAEKAIRILELQLPGSRRLPVRDVLNAHGDLFQLGVVFS